MIEILTDKKVNEIFDSKNTLSPAPRRIYDDGRLMTREEAKEILETSKEIAPLTQGDVVYHNKVGEFYKETPDSFVFVVYPYTSHIPINPSRAWEYRVLKDTGEIVYGTAPMPEDEIKEAQGQS